MIQVLKPLLGGNVDMERTDSLLDFLRSPDCTERSIEALGGWLWETDGAHRFTYMSDGVHQFGRRPAEAHYGKTRQEIGNLSLDDPTSMRWLAALERGAGFGPFDFVRVEDGSIVTFRTVGVSCYDQRGRFRGYAGIAFRVHGAGERPLLARGAERRKAMLVAEMIIGNRDPVFCVLDEISARGARLLAPDLLHVPGVFLLRGLGSPRDVRVCELRWRKGACIGVSFAKVVS